MNHLRRELAPIPEAAWEQIDDEATRCLQLYLGARKLVDVVGPLGWQTDAVTTGTVAPSADVAHGVAAAVRQPLPLTELVTGFEMSLADLDTADRGNPAIDTDAVIDAARRAALAEDQAVFHGLAGAYAGIVDSAPRTIPLAASPIDYPTQVAAAVSVLRQAGVAGPYAIALGDQEYTAVSETTEHGYPVMKHLSTLVGGEVVWVPALEGAVVSSLRGGDFQLTIGQEFSIGYTGTTGDVVSLYLQESIAFRVLTPEAAVHLSRG